LRASASVPGGSWRAARRTAPSTRHSSGRMSSAAKGWRETAIRSMSRILFLAAETRALCAVTGWPSSGGRADQGRAEQAVWKIASQLRRRSRAGRPRRGVT